jgi:RHS repeat-associated protein
MPRFVRGGRGWLVLFGSVALLGASGTAARAQVSPTPSLSAATVTLPDGPGSVKGLSDAAQLSSFSAQVQYAVPIRVPSAGGLSPSVSLSYSGALGNGPVGIGWTLSAPAIRRTLNEGVPRYDASDELAIEGVAAGRLVPIWTVGSTVEMAVEGAGRTFRVRHVRGAYIEVTDPDGTTYVFGRTAQARIEDGTRVAAWLLEEVVNLANEEMRFTYRADRGQRYLSRVEWGPGRRYRLDLHLEARPDVTTSFATGFEVTTALRIGAISSTVAIPGETTELARYDLRYDNEDEERADSEHGALSRLVRVTMSGRRRPDGTPLDSATLPPLTFGYATPDRPRSWAMTTDGWVLDQRGVGLFDLDGDGAEDLLRLEPGYAAWRKNRGGTFAPAASVDGASGLELADVKFLDVDGDARSEVVRIVDDTWRAYSLAREGGRVRLGPGRTLDGTRGVPLAAQGMVLADVNGDGRTDVLESVTSGLRLRQGTAQGLGPAIYLPALADASPNVEPGAENVRFTDMNGDGLVDAVWLTDAWMKVFLGRGNGTFHPFAKVFYPWGLSALRVEDLQLADLDRDGVIDLLRIDAAKVRWFRGLAGFRFQVLPRQLARPDSAALDARVAFVDVDGNGSAEVVWSTPGGMWALDLAGGTTRAMVGTINDGLGETTTFTYGTSTQLSLAAEAAGQSWERLLPRSMAVPIRQVVTYADGTPSRVIEAGVRDGFWDGAERRFGGFLVARTVVPADTAALVRVEETVFLAGEGDGRVLRGMAVEARVRDGLGALYTETVADWVAIRPRSLDGAMDPSNPLLRRAALRTEEVRNHEGVTTPIATRVETSFDDEVRPFEERNHGRTDLTGDEHTTWRLFASQEEPWIRDRLLEEAAYTGIGTHPSALLSRNRHYFGTHQGDPLPHPQLGNGWPRRSEGLHWSAGSAPTPQRWITLSTTGYDEHGNVIATTDGPSRSEAPTGGGVTRTLEYDADGLFPVRESVEPAAGRVVSWTAAWDPVLGAVASVTTPAGNTTHVEYDSLARVVALRQNGRLPHQRYAYEWSAPRARTFSYTYERDAPSLATYGNAWARTDAYVGWTHRVTVADSSGDALFTAGRLGTNKWLISGWKRKDGRGRVTEVLEGFTHESATLPVAPPASLRRQLLRYDAMDRAYQHELPTGARTTKTFRAFEQSMAVDGLAAVTSRFDGQGRITRTQRTVDGCAESVDATYDAAGRILALELQKAAAGAPAPCSGATSPVAHRFVYDSFGRLIEADDPDIGLRLMTYDDAGHMTRHVNGAGQGITLGYDFAGRLTSRVADDGTRYDYRYDVDVYGSPTPGYLSTIDEPTGQVRLRYDEFGRNHYIWRQVGSTRSLRELGIAPSGSVYVERYVRDWSVRYHRDMAGRVTRVVSTEVSAATTLWEATSFDSAGRLATERFGNGVVGSYTYDGNGQTDRVVIQRSAGGQRLYDVDLTRNEWGAVTLVDDTDLSGIDHDGTFGYDTAGRLTSADIGARSGSAPVPYAFTYQYDGLQNMVDRTATMATPRPLGQHLGAHCYGQNGAGPRQLTSIVTGASGPATCDSGAPVVASFTYDDAGRQLTDGTALMTYDGLDQLVTVNLPGGVRLDYAYGYDGQRIRTTDNQGSAPEHWFSPDVREVGGVLEQYIKVGDRIVAKVKLADDGAKPTIAAATTRAVGREVGLGLLGGLVLLLGGFGAVVSARRSSWRPSLAMLLVVALLTPGCGALFGSSESPIWRAEETTYFHTGFAAGPVLITSDDPSPRVVDERLYEPFGQGLESTREPGGFFDRVDYALEPVNVLNKPTDPRTGWSYHGARWMAPQTGRWLTPDPPVKAPDRNFMAAPWKLHPYQYAEQNPTVYWDPDGRAVWFVAAAVCAGGACEAAAAAAGTALVVGSAAIIGAAISTTDVVADTADRIRNGESVAPAIDKLQRDIAELLKATEPSPTPEPSRTADVAPVPQSQSDDEDDDEPEPYVLYRAMSQKEYDRMDNAGGLAFKTNGGEKMLSQEQWYAENLLRTKPREYQVLVKFTMKPTAPGVLLAHGVHHQSLAANPAYAWMPPVQPGWTGRDEVMFKLERGALNIGVGPEARQTFNNQIDSWENITP